MEKTLKSFEQLLIIMDELREKCPWDREQTFESLRNLTVEEVYELSQAIEEKKYDEIKKELGDILLHIVFYSKLGDEKQFFNINDVIENLNKKLIFRHPHVFGETKVANSNEVVENWEQLKLKEKDGNKSVLSGVPKNLPALIKAYRIQDKARGVGFDWDFKEQVWEKVKEEINELQAEISNKNQQKIEEEFGDLIFSVINAARLYNVHPEDALEKTNKKFIKRFEYLENNTLKLGKSLKEMTLDEMNVIWDQAKNYE